MQDFFNALHVDEVDQSELELVIQSHFRFAHAPNPYEIRYGPHDPHEQPPPALIVRYGRKSGRITNIEPGPSLGSDDITQIAEKVQALLLNASEFCIGQVVMFSRLPLNGWFRYRDRFQLIPVPPEAPRPDPGMWAVGGFPLLLQYRFAGSPDPSLQNLRRFNTHRELELLCSALSQHIEGAIPPMVRYHWFTRTSGDPPQQFTEFGPEGYGWPAFSGGLAPEYSSVDAWKVVRRIPHEEYYQQPNLWVGADLMLPETFEWLLDAYFQRDPEERDRFIRASHWYQFANYGAAGGYATGRYSALCSAVETLMGPEPSHQKKCSRCGRTVGGGVSRRFRQFLEQWAPGPSISAADRTRLYGLRSKVTHGGRLLHSDRFGWGVAFSPGRLQDWADFSAMQLLVRVILINWLAGADGSGTAKNRRSSSKECLHFVLRWVRRALAEIGLSGLSP